MRIRTLPLVFIILASCFTQPDIPEIYPKEINKEVAKLCLQDIPERYQDRYLTYRGHFDAWYLKWKDKFGFNLSDGDKRYFTGYSSFEMAVYCYIMASGDSGLNMTLSPTEFKAIFESISEELGVVAVLN